VLDAFLRALQGGRLPSGTRLELDDRFGAEVVARLVAAGLLVPGDRATHYPCPGGGSSCPRAVVPNVGDPDYPFVAVPPGDDFCCLTVRLTADDLATWTTSRRRLVEVISELFHVRGPANLREEVFPSAHRLGRTTPPDRASEVLFCTNLNGPAPVAHLLARKAQRQSTLVLAHARTRFTSPDLEAHFGSGDVEVLFLEDGLVLDASGLRRNPVLHSAEPAGPRYPPPCCILVDAEGAREIDDETYRSVLERAVELDLFLDLTRTVEAGRHPTGRRENGKAVPSSVTAAEGRAYAELVERRQPLRAAELQSVDGKNHPVKLIESARRELDVRLGRYKWRSTELLRGDTSEANRYQFRPPEDLRWALLRPLAVEQS
jgi:hypothetical protein